MATNKPQDDYQKQGVRIPRRLHEQIHEAAVTSGRSYNSELVQRLEQTFTDHRDSNTQAGMLAEIYFLLDAQKQELLALHKQSMAELIEAANTPPDQRKRLASKLPDATAPSIEAGVKRLRPKVHETVRTEHPFLDDRRRNSKTAK